MLIVVLSGRLRGCKNSGPPHFSAQADRTPAPIWNGPDGNGACEPKDITGSLPSERPSPEPLTMHLAASGGPHRPRCHTGFQWASVNICAWHGAGAVLMVRTSSSQSQCNWDISLLLETPQQSDYLKKKTTYNDHRVPSIERKVRMIKFYNEVCL